MSSSQDAKEIARAWAEAAGFATGIDGRIILLPDFEREADCHFFFPGRTKLFHRMIVKAAARAIRVAGGKAITHLVHPKDYRAWLGEGEDTDTARAKFIADQTRIT